VLLGLKNRQESYVTLGFACMASYVILATVHRRQLKENVTPWLVPAGSRNITYSVHNLTFFTGSRDQVAG